jgi:hypothetical protein
MIRRKILIAVLALGTVGGFASGIHSMRRCAYRRHHMEQRYMEKCGDRSDRDDGPRHHPRKWSEEE